MPCAPAVRSPNAATAASIFGVGQVVGDDDVDHVRLGGRPDDDGLEPLAGLRVEPVAGSAGDRRRWSSPGSGSARCAGGRRPRSRPSRRRSGLRPRRRRAPPRGPPRTSHVPPAKRTSSMPASASDPRFSARAVAARVERFGRALLVRRRDQRLEIRVGARAPSRRRCTAPRRVERRRRPRRGAARRGAQPWRRQGQQRGSRRDIAAGSRTDAPPGWCVLAPGTGVPDWCAHAPDLPTRPIGTRVPLPSGRRTSRKVLTTPTRDRTGKLPGASVTERETDARLEEVRRRRSRVSDHEPSNWIIRPTGLVDRRGGSTDRRLHSRLGRPPVSGGDLAFPAQAS